MSRSDASGLVYFAEDAGVSVFIEKARKVGLKNAGCPPTVEHGRTLPELKHNDILAEFAAHYDRESKLMADTSPLKKP